MFALLILVCDSFLVSQADEAWKAANSKPGRKLLVEKYKKKNRGEGTHLEKRCAQTYKHVHCTLYTQDTHNTYKHQPRTVHTIPFESH